ncbi:chemotaxis protein CheA [Inquilinus sp.]|jgi:two-component system chemotaxis sensor kinase CheA|uniref:chemotaxis protein CheA n=1 Tax=Inquilinus sp. TaxID=1932117 RepID=UPI003784A5AD
MNEFIEQFLIESRELVEQASDDLLTLEQRPDDRERLDSAFRAFHTLKGAAGIVDFAAMARAMHAAEDVLAALRAGAGRVSTELISHCLACLDQVVRWLDGMAADGEPPGDADTAADAVVQRFAGLSILAPAQAVAAPDRSAAAGWMTALLAGHPAAASRARTAVRYAPDPACFFRGEDPLALIAGLGGVESLRIETIGPWPELDALDPFACRLILLTLTTVSAEEAGRHLASVRDQVEILPVPPALGSMDAAQLSPAGRAVLEEQIRLLAEAGAEGFAGTLASAGRAAMNVMRSLGRPADADGLGQALASSAAAWDPAFLRAAIRQVLDGASVASPGLAPVEPDPGPAQPDGAARVMRVDVERIDALMKLAGELTVAKNALGHALGLAQGGADGQALALILKDQHGHLDRLVSELQQAVLGIRVLPLQRVFQRFPRLVREMAGSLGKEARLVVEGAATEADKTIVEALFEPLLHGLRNAVDHGIETPAERAAFGKPVPAMIRLAAERAGEQLVVSIADDGRGIDIARVRGIAADREILPAADLAALPDDKVLDLVFAPGFSTAEGVSGWSGRGVGMDAIRTAVEQLGGRVVLDSRAGQGTTLRLTLPFSVMMTRVMMVEAGGQMFGIPFDAVLETVRVGRDRIVPVGTARAFVLRNRTIPLVALAEAIGGHAEAEPPPEANIVVAVVGGQVCGVEVDRFEGRLEVMLKPMDGLLAGMPGLTGTTLLGDGRVLIVLDLQGLLQ